MGVPNARSAPGEAGSCPLPGAEVYTVGLTAGDWCVELTIEDGGLNDGDGESNGRISHLGGVTTLLSVGEVDGNIGDSDVENGDSTSNSDDGNGGGGALSFWWLLLLSLLIHKARGVVLRFTVGIGRNRAVYSQNRNSARFVACQAHL